MEAGPFAQYGIPGLMILVAYLLGRRGLDIIEARMKQSADADDKRTNAMVEGFKLQAASNERIVERLAERFGAEISDLRVDVARMQGKSESVDTTGVHAIPQHITPPQGTYSQHRPRTQGGR